MDLCNILFWHSRFKGDETDRWCRSTHFSSSASVRVWGFQLNVSTTILWIGLKFGTHIQVQHRKKWDGSTLCPAPPSGKKFHLRDQKCSSFLSASAYCVVKSKGKSELFTEVIKIKWEVGSFFHKLTYNQPSFWNQWSHPSLVIIKSWGSLVRP